MVIVAERQIGTMILSMNWLQNCDNMSMFVLSTGHAALFKGLGTVYKYGALIIVWTSHWNICVACLRVACSGPCLVYRPLQQALVKVDFLKNCCTFLTRISTWLQNLAFQYPFSIDYCLVNFLMLDFALVEIEDNITSILLKLMYTHLYSGNKSLFPAAWVYNIDNVLRTDEGSSRDGFTTLWMHGPSLILKAFSMDLWVVGSPGG